MTITSRRGMTIASGRGMTIAGGRDMTITGGRDMTIASGRDMIIAGGRDKSRPYSIGGMLGLATEAAAQHFLVAGKIVWAFDGLDFEAAILAIFGATVRKD